MNKVKTGPIRRPPQGRWRPSCPQYGRYYRPQYGETFRNHDRLAYVRDRQRLRFRLRYLFHKRHFYYMVRWPVRRKIPTFPIRPYNMRLVPALYWRTPNTARERRRKIRERQRLREHTRKRVLRRLLTHVYADIAVCRYLCDETLNRLLSVCSWEDAP